MADAKKKRGPRLAGATFVLLVLGGLATWVVASHGGGPRRRTVAAAAQAGTNPCAYREIHDDEGGETFRNPPELRATGKRLKGSVTAEYTDRAMTEIAGCPLHLRSYDGELVGPTLRIRPGQTLDLKLHNDLPRQSPAEVRENRQQEKGVAHLAVAPHPFNVTNMHFHGMHVSPRGNGDNVLLEVRPQQTERYEIEVPDNHPPGSFWYHAHGHGSTAIQVASGMAGAIVVEDDPAAIPPELAAANAREKVMVLYDADGERERLSALFPAPPGPPPPHPCQGKRHTCTWEPSQRRSTINGQLAPRIYMRPGEVQRWRLVDSSFNQTFEIQLEEHALHEIALDGLYLGRIDTWEPGQSIELAPGYRSDVLVEASMEEGTCRLLDVPTPAREALRGQNEDQEVLAEVVVRGEPVDMSLPTSEEMASLAPFGDVQLKEQATGVQVAGFRVGADLVPAPTERFYFHINYRAFDPKQVRRLELGAVDEWVLGSENAAPLEPNDPSQDPDIHVFHIHVNPFQVQRDGPDGTAEWVWKDTLAVSSNETPVSVYTKYRRFTDKFVIHCHILDHEDLGMMEVVKVVKPGALLDRPPTPHH